MAQPIEGLYRDRYSYDRREILSDAVKAWRLNPLAWRIANLFEYYVIDGIQFKSEDANTQAFLNQFWTHDLNNMKFKLKMMAKELFLTGNLFPLFSVDTSGMTYFRLFPTDRIDTIQTAPNDLEQEISYTTLTNVNELDAQTYKNPRGLPSISTPVFMKHYSINRLAGTVWGEGEIWPDLPWLSRYARWMEDRVRLNHWRSAFMYVVAGQYDSETDRAKRERELNMNPPTPGSILVMNRDNGEAWGVLSPQLDAFDASTDGIAIKKMVAVNHVPMHYLAEPEASTSTTADAAGNPTFKAFESNQNDFVDILMDILQTVIKRRAEKDPTVKPEAKLEILTADATQRDNASLAIATSRIVDAIGELYDRELIDENEYMRLVYRFAGEVKPPDLKFGKGLRKPLGRADIKSTSPTSATKSPKHSSPASATPDGKVKTNADTGDVHVSIPSGG